MKIFAVLIIIGVIITGYFLQQPRLVKSDDPVMQLHHHEHPPAHQKTGEPQRTHPEHATHQEATQTQTSGSEPSKSTTGNPHFDQLTPEMQQAVKDSLLLEGPMRTYTREDGAIVLPAEGRFTQMPVAVEMPDGSIEIREYSVVPKASPPSDQ